MKKIGLTYHPKRKPNGITKADREAMKSDDLLKRDFCSDEPLKKCITDITEIKAKDGKLYTSVIFDCFDLSVLGIAMSTDMKAELCVQTLDNAMASYSALHGTILHSDRGAQYTSNLYRKAIIRYGICQSMNSAGGRCHDNDRCESMWARMRTERLCLFVSILVYGSRQAFFDVLFITTHVHLCSVFKNTVVFQVDFQTGTAQSVCGIPHQIEPFKNRLLLRWAVILRDANNNFNFLHTIDNPPPKPNLYHSIWKIGCSSHFRIDRALRCHVL